MPQDDCLNLRKVSDEADGAAAFHKHMEACPGCQQWHRQNEEMLAMVSATPQFDVPEALTQSVMSAVAAQPRRQLANTLIVPVGVVAMAAMCTVMPVDSIEGLVSTGVGLLGLFGVYLLVKSAPAEDVIA